MNLNFEKMGGLLPVVIQDYKTRDVLMVGFMNEEAFQKTLATKTVWFWSRTKNRLWNKGESSGHYQNVKKMVVDCDFDTLLVQVEQVGGTTCHTGNVSCFFTQI